MCDWGDFLADFAIFRLSYRKGREEREAITAGLSGCRGYFITRKFRLLTSVSLGRFHFCFAGSRALVLDLTRNLNQVRCSMLCRIDEDTIEHNPCYPKRRAPV